MYYLTSAFLILPPTEAFDLPHYWLRLGSHKRRSSLHFVVFESCLLEARSVTTPAPNPAPPHHHHLFRGRDINFPALISEVVSAVNGRKKCSVHFCSPPVYISVSEVPRLNLAVSRVLLDDEDITSNRVRGG